MAKYNFYKKNIFGGSNDTTKDIVSVPEESKQESIQEPVQDQVIVAPIQKKKTILNFDPIILTLGQKDRIDLDPLILKAFFGGV